MQPSPCCGNDSVAFLALISSARLLCPALQEVTRRGVSFHVSKGTGRREKVAKVSKYHERLMPAVEQTCMLTPEIPHCL